MTLATGALLTLTGSSALTDLLHDRIYNVVVVPMAVLGLLLAGAPMLGGSPLALAERGGSMLLVLALLLPFWMCLPGSIGGGDIKLYLAVAALLPRRAFLILLFVSLAGAGGMGLLRRLWRPRVRRVRIGPVVFCAALIYAGGFYG